MANQTETGKEGEQLAVDYLLQNGFIILHRNWRFSHYEIDIIALKDARLHFIEVKFRQSKRFGLPEESVSKKKIKCLLEAAGEFLFRHKQYKDFRIDILSVRMYPDTATEFYFIQDIYL